MEFRKNSVVNVTWPEMVVDKTLFELYIIDQCQILTNLWSSFSDLHREGSILIEHVMLPSTNLLFRIPLYKFKYVINQNRTQNACKDSNLAVYFEFDGILCGLIGTMDSLFGRNHLWETQHINTCCRRKTTQISSARFVLLLDF